MTMPHYGVRDASHQGPPYSAPTSAAHHYEPGTYLFGQGDDLVIGLAHAEVSLRHRPARRPHPFCFGVEHLASLPLELALEFGVKTLGYQLVSRQLHRIDVRIGGLPDVEHV